MTNQPAPASNLVETKTLAPRTNGFRLSAKEFRADDRSTFTNLFRQHLKPAISNWAKAYNGHVPLGPEDVSEANLVEQIGRTAAYHEYVFVVDGITLGVQDANGVARVDYLNDPTKTRKLVALPNGSEAPIVTPPVSREEVTRMVEADSGSHFAPHEIRMIPSALSGNLNGGLLVHVGGTPENIASWKYDLVFGSGGALAYYLKGNN